MMEIWRRGAWIERKCWLSWRYRLIISDISSPFFEQPIWRAAESKGVEVWSWIHEEICCLRWNYRAFANFQTKIHASFVRFLPNLGRILLKKKIFFPPPTPLNLNFLLCRLLTQSRLGLGLDWDWSFVVWFNWRNDGIERKKQFENSSQKTKTTTAGKRKLESLLPSFGGWAEWEKENYVPKELTNLSLHRLSTPQKGFFQHFMALQAADPWPEKWAQPKNRRPKSMYPIHTAGHRAILAAARLHQRGPTPRTLGAS